MGVFVAIDCQCVGLVGRGLATSTAGLDGWEEFRTHSALDLGITLCFFHFQTDLWVEMPIFVGGSC